MYTYSLVNVHVIQVKSKQLNFLAFTYACQVLYGCMQAFTMLLLTCLAIFTAMLILLSDMLIEKNYTEIGIIKRRYIALYISIPKF